MSYLNCPSCGLSVRLRADYLALEHCPRCLARRRVASVMYVSERPGVAEPTATPAVGWDGSADARESSG